MITISNGRTLSGGRRILLTTEGTTTTVEIGRVRREDEGYSIALWIDWQCRSAGERYTVWVGAWSQVPGAIVAGLNELSQRHNRERRTVPLTRRAWREGVAREHVDARGGSP